MNETMGDIIRRLRLERGLTQEELGKVIGVQGAAIRKYESGRVENIKQSSIKKLADFFCVSPAYLMGWKEDDTTLPENPTLTGMKAEIVELVATMPEEKQKLLLELIKSMKNSR